MALLAHASIVLYHLQWENFRFLLLVEDIFFSLWSLFKVIGYMLFTFSGKSLQSKIVFTSRNIISSHFHSCLRIIIFIILHVFS